MKFSIGSIVVHESGGRYEIVGRANVQFCLNKSYIQRSIDTDELWVCSYEQMEDGRFELEAQTEEAYVRNPRCPSCGSPELQWTLDVAFNGDSLTQIVVCENCGHGHQSVYTLTGYEAQ